jgi:hypothetical protein
MAVDGPHDDGSPYERYRRADAVDTERMAAARPDTSQPSEQLHREECYHELRAHQATDNHSGARDADDKPERITEGGWKRKGLELDPAANRIADDAIAARREAEGRDAEGNYAEAGITPAMRSIEGELEHGSLVPDTERFALKSPDRFKEKLAGLIERRPDELAADLAAEIPDGIRYTFLFEVDRYTDAVGVACASIEGSGCELTRLANRWDGEEYKGVNSRWLHIESGQSFEVQFHTQESWDVKQANHDAYERANDPTTDIGEIELLRAYQASGTKSITMPDRWHDIENYQLPES